MKHSSSSVRRIVSLPDFHLLHTSSFRWWEYLIAFLVASVLIAGKCS